MHYQVKAKKHLGQHFLTDLSIAKDIVDAITWHNDYQNLVEIGPGMGVLTQFMTQLESPRNLKMIEIDHESVSYLKSHFPSLSKSIISGDFLEIDISKELNPPIGIIGNFPYNISSQIFFKVIENPDLVCEVVCMLQKEVAVRLCSGPGKKDYGILSVFLQAYYDMEYLFTVHEHVFNPPPKVKSGVIRLKRNTRKELPCNQALFIKVVKQGFNQRRKTLRNAMRSMELSQEFTSMPIFDKRAEQLSVEDFFNFTNDIEKDLNKKITL